MACKKWHLPNLRQQNQDVNPLKKLFGPKINTFLAELGQDHLLVVSLNQSNAPSFHFEGASEEEIRERLNLDMEETAGEQPRQLFEYDKKGRHILPVFSSPEAVSQWMKRKPFSLDSQMFAFTQMRMQTLVLFTKLKHLPVSTYVMLDPETPEERELMPIEIRQTLEHFRR
ncbi:hypothetical protein IAD21_03399 [Abditibacteriota bacterium]|nr:hypothetical protein IAD21_03399 [Abditibacteriota bacterium]